MDNKETISEEEVSAANAKLQGLYWKYMQQKDPVTERPKIDFWLSEDWQKDADNFFITS